MIGKKWGLKKHNFLLKRNILEIQLLDEKVKNGIFFIFQCYFEDHLNEERIEIAEHHLHHELIIVWNQLFDNLHKFIVWPRTNLFLKNISNLNELLSFCFQLLGNKLVQQS